MSNHHYDYATAAFESASAKADPKFNKEVRSDALIQATLALAYEQRTANLIAYEAGLSQSYRDNALNENGLRLWKLAADQITERLDLA